MITFEINKILIYEYISLNKLIFFFIVFGKENCKKKTSSCYPLEDRCKLVMVLQVYAFKVDIRRVTSVG